MKKALIFLFVLTGMAVIAQDTLPKPYRTIVKPAYLQGMDNTRQRSSSRLVDSLVQANQELRTANDSLLMLINQQLTRSQSLEQQSIQAKAENNRLLRELDDARGDQIQTSHTSSILLIFNIIAGIILLIALIWIFTRKKHVQEDADTPVRPMTVSAPVSLADPVETRLERIEKLGRLRDKGLLTEDEFQMQKKQLLG